MAIAPTAPGNSGKAAPSPSEGTRIEPKTTDAGTELEATPPVATPLDESRPIPEGEAASGAVAASETSAAHLSGANAELVGEVDRTFARLLAEVHQNRPGDDLDVIRRAWAVCLGQYEGQMRA